MASFVHVCYFALHYSLPLIILIHSNLLRGIDNKIVTHCSYLDIYISQKLRLCVVDFEGKFQTNLLTKLINFLVWKFRSIMRIFLLFLQNLSNPLLFTYCCCYFKDLVDRLELQFFFYFLQNLSNDPCMDFYF